MLALVLLFILLLALFGGLGILFHPFFFILLVVVLIAGLVGGGYGGYRR